MTISSTTFQSGLRCALMGDDTGSVGTAWQGFPFTATGRRPWRDGHTMIAAHMVLTLVPDAERQRLVTEYLDQSGDLATFPPADNAAFLEFLVPRLPDPSHALSLCRMDRALTRARLGSDAFGVPERRTVRARVERSIRKRLEHEAWEHIGRDVWDPIETDLHDHIEAEAWKCINRAILGRINRGPHASLVWFHAEPEAVLRALHGGPPPPVSEPAYPLLFAPGLPNLYRVATDEEAALWSTLPRAGAPPDLIEQLLAEGAITYAE